MCLPNSWHEQFPAQIFREERERCWVGSALQYLLGIREVGCKIQAPESLVCVCLAPTISLHISESQGDWEE